MRSARSNTVTVCPARVSCCAAARPAGPGADDGDRLAGQTGRVDRLHPALVESVVDDLDLDLLDGHRILVDPEHAGRLTRRRAQPPGELREVVGRVQPVDGVAPAVAVDQVVPLGNQVAQRAAVVAERDTAVHAATGLRPAGCPRADGPRSRTPLSSRAGAAAPGAESGFPAGCASEIHSGHPRAAPVLSLVDSALLADCVTAQPRAASMMASLTSLPSASAAEIASSTFL